MKMTKQVRKEVERALRCVENALSVLEKSKGWAESIPEDRALGSDYNIRNKACLEHCAGAVPHVRVYSYVGSNAVQVWTARDVLRGLLREDI